MADPDLAVEVRELCVHGREAYQRRFWADAYAALAAADERAELAAPDLELLANAAFLVGADPVGYDRLARAYRAWVDRSESTQAARCAVWLALFFGLQGEGAASNGWAARARRQVDAADPNGSARGYLAVLEAMERLDAGEYAGSLIATRIIVTTGERCADSDLLALGQLCMAEALIPVGEVARATECLDEAIVAVTAGEVGPLATGILYCAVIEACQKIFDLRRAQEWTAALTRWCASQPDLVPFRGSCLVHRAEIMRMRGSWADADDEIREACERLATRPAAGAAYYELAELHRLRGQTELAERAYRQACRWIPDPQPGLALLRLSQGQADAAVAAIRRALDETHGDVARSPLLAAAVEILTATGDVAAARDAADELGAIAGRIGGPWLLAMSETAEGATLVAAGDGTAALPVLRRAWTGWQRLGAPYEAARTRVLMAEACLGCDDPTSAELELDAAGLVFEQLGAAADLARARDLARSPEPGPLTSRELEVLRHLADGQTNRAIAADLIISEKTVARHVSNIFAKLDVSSRAAATAYAYRHELI